MAQLNIRRIAFLLVMFFLIQNNGFAQTGSSSKIDTLLLSLKTAKQDTMKAKFMFRIGEVYSTMHSDSAFYYNSIGKSLAYRIGFSKGINSFETQIGILLSDQGKNLEAIPHYEAALRVGKKENNKIWIAKALINIASAYQRSNQSVKATDYNIQGLKQAEEIKNTNLIALASSNLSVIFSEQENFQKALEYANRALKIAEQDQNQQQIGITKDQIGSILLQQGKEEESRIYFKEAIKMARLVADENAQAEALGHLALSYSKDEDKKIEYLLETQVIFDRIAVKSNNSIANIGNIGGTYGSMALHNPKYKNNPAKRKILISKSYLYLNRAIAYSKEVGEAANLSYFSDNLSQIQVADGNYKDALYNFMISKAIDDSLYSQANKNKIASLEGQRKLEVRDKEILANKLHIKQLWLYGILVLAAICFVSLFFLNRYRIHQLRLKHTLQKKESEQMAIELKHQNKLSESELKAIRTQMNPHFIFNVLNSIESYIMENDRFTASRLVQKFAALSRLILENSIKSLVTAEKEWKALLLYTELQAIRYGNDFSYRFSIDEDIQLSNVLLPPMLVQPLIENSIQHGLIPDDQTDKFLEVKMEQTEKEIRITVTDNGIGLSKSSPATKMQGIKEKSMGIESIRERVDMINTQYETDIASFSILDGENGKGTIAILTLPLLLQTEKTSRFQTA